MIKLKFTITGSLLAFFFLLCTTISAQITPGETSLDWFTHAGHVSIPQNNLPATRGIGVKVDKEGAVYTIGTFYDVVHFGSFTLSSNTGINQGNCFITKQDANGNYIWAKNIGGFPGSRLFDYLSLTDRTRSLTHCIAVKNGAIFICGNVGGNSSADFNPGPGVNHLPIGNRTGFVLKLDTAGNFNWVKEIIPQPNIGSGHTVLPSGVGVDDNGNCYVVGVAMKTDTIKVGSTIAENSGSHYSPAISDPIFYAKFDPYGNCVWLRLSQDANGYQCGNFGGAHYTNGHGGLPNLIVTPNGTSYICSPFQGDFQLKTGLSSPKKCFFWHAGSGPPANSNYSDMMLAKINSNGWCTWGTYWGDMYIPNGWNGHEYGCSIAFNSKANKLALVGTYFSQSTFSSGAGSGPDTTLECPAGFSNTLDFIHLGMYIVDFDLSSGNPTRDWIKNFTQPSGGGGAFGNLFAKNVAMDGNGNVYICNDQWVGKMDYEPNDTTSSIFVASTVFSGLAKYDSNGNFKWLNYAPKQGGSDGFLDYMAIAISPCNDKVYTTGIFSGTVDVDPTPATNYTTSTAPIPDGYSHYDMFTWAINQDNVPNPITITSGYNSPLCVGQFLQLNASTSGAASYSWTGPNGFSSNQQNPGIGSITAADAGDYIVTVKNASGCSNKDTVHVGIGLFPPNAGTLTSPSVSLCSGATLNVTTNGNPGGTWQVINAGGTATINNSGVVTGGNPGFVAVKYIDTKSCGSDTASIALQVLAQPNAGILSGSFVACANTPDTISTNGDTGGAWSIDNGAGAATINNNGIVTGTSPGFVTVQYIVNNTCGADTATKNLFVMAQPNAGAISGPTSICKGDSITLTSSGDPSGAWSSSNGFGAYVNSLGVVKGVLPGSYTISYIVSNGCGADTTTYSIVVNNGANAGTINGIDTLCVGMPVTYTSNGDVGGTWTVINGTGPTGSGAASVDNNGLVTGTNAGLFTLQYTINSTCGTDAATKNVMVLAKPNAGTINGASNTVCLNSTLQLTSSGDTGGIWSATNGNCSVSSTGEVTGISQGTSTVEYIVSGICGSDTATYSITIEKLGTKKVNTYKECDGFSITVNGNTYNSTGTYTDFVGCDTIITALTIIPNPQLVLNKKDASCKENNGSAKAIGISQNPPISYDWSNNSTDSLISNLSPGVYTVIISDSMGCTTTGSTTIANIDNECGYVVSLPGAFTPNGDGKNDLLLVNGKGIKTLDFKVFNRWGNLVFQTTDPTKGWDGIYNGKEQNTAVFMYTINVTFVNGKTVTKSGDVGLIR